MRFTLNMLPDGNGNNRIAQKYLKKELPEKDFILSFSGVLVRLRINGARAKRVGFYDYRYFPKVFNTLKGLPPKGY